jgi:hypothetical protein
VGGGGGGAGLFFLGASVCCPQGMVVGEGGREEVDMGCCLLS